MATGAILTVLSNIPWGQVVENAPKVADGAARLWNAVTSRKKSKLSPDSQYAPDLAASTNKEDLQSKQIAALEESVRNLQEQMQASTELIKTLAEQNTQFVQQIELYRTRLARLVMAFALAGAGMLAVVLYLLLRS